MWFGNLVTMKWWDDLWLNEAFATALSYRACHVAGALSMEYLEETQILFGSYKRWGLSEDMRSSCHSIIAKCCDTEQASSLLDGITYGKGSSLIKQLIYILGWDNFTTSMRMYFQKYKWQNASLKELLQCLQTGYNQESEQPLDL